MKTPQELFKEYCSFGDCKLLYDPNLSEEDREKQREIAAQIEASGYIVAWGPKSGSYLYKV